MTEELVFEVVRGVVMGINYQDSQQVHPCMLGRDIHVAHGPGSQYPPQLRTQRR